MRLRRALAVVGGAALAVVLAACGIPAEKQATLAKAQNVPFDLLAPGGETTSTTLGGSSTAKVRIFLAQGERLAAVDRRVPAPPTPETILETLVNGPTDTEVALGLRTALLGEDVLLVRSVGVTGGIATVDLGPTFIEITGRDQILALAQIVATLTELPGIGRVSFTLEGNPVGVPRGDGAITTDSVSRDDYSLVAPLPLG